METKLKLRDFKFAFTYDYNKIFCPFRMNVKALKSMMKPENENVAYSKTNINLSISEIIEQNMDMIGR